MRRWQINHLEKDGFFFAIGRLTETGCGEPLDCVGAMSEQSARDAEKQLREAIAKDYPA